jgi:hypothetical protein
MTLTADTVYVLAIAVGVLGVCWICAQELLR